MEQRFRLRWLPPALLAAATLTGCVFAPGGHIDYQTDAAPLDELVDLQPITPGLVAGFSRNGVQSAPPSEELRQQLDSYEYRIGVGDVLNIIVYDHPELTIPAGGERSAEESGNEVYRDGTIFYPYLGRLEVAGRTLDETRGILANGLAAVIAEPQVEVKVAAFRSQKVHVSGAVNEPGPLPITTVPLTLVDAISQVGGATAEANWHQVKLTRDGQDYQMSLYNLLRQGDMQGNRLLQDGDLLHVPSAEDQNVFVLGEVLHPQNISLGNERLSLADALSQAGGINERQADASGVFVIRQQPEGSDKLATVYQLNMANATALVMGAKFRLEPQDVIYVTAAPVSRWNRVISQLLPSVTGSGQIVNLAGDSQDL